MEALKYIEHINDKVSEEILEIEPSRIDFIDLGVVSSIYFVSMILLLAFECGII